uniref:Uncharacterized protein n=1 Tax=Solanum tuberosum TaxID=4113 RepID=M1E076_SOLTU
MKREEKEAATAQAATDSRRLRQLLMTRIAAAMRQWDGGRSVRSREKEENMGNGEKSCENCLRSPQHFSKMFLDDNGRFWGISYIYIN